MSNIIVSNHENGQGSAKAYVIGFAISIILTLGSYIIATRELAHGWNLVYALSVLAVTQLIVQLVFFLHVGRESKPRWNTTALLFAVMVVVILVFGSLWIMKNLDSYHGKAPSTEEIIKDEGYQPLNY